jgi:chlorite dismutase
MAHNGTGTPTLQHANQTQWGSGSHLCFFPVDGRRGEAQNWYTEAMSDRQRMMHEHGMIGRRYADFGAADHHRIDRL